MQLPKTDSLHVDTEEVRNALHEIFPNLTDEELDTYASKLDVEGVLALEAELADIRTVSDGLSKALEALATQNAEQRKTELATQNDGYPTDLEPLGRVAYYDSAHGEGRVDFSGVFQGHDSVQLEATDVSVSVAGKAQKITLTCAQSQPVDIVFLVDITGSMTPIIGALRRSLNAFVSAIAAQR